MPAPDYSVSDLKMWEIWQSMTQLHSLMAADELGLFNHLKDGPKTIETLATDMGIEQRAAAAVVEYMAAMDFLGKTSDGYTLNGVSETYLLPESRYYWGNIFGPIKQHPLRYDMFVNALKKNQSTIHGDNPLFKFIEDEENRAREFSYSLISRGKYSAGELAKSRAFANTTHLLDVGGGLGLFSAQLVSSNRGMKSTIIELPIICKLGAEYLEAEWSRQGVASNISFKSLDFFNDPWPTNADGIFFSDIFHDWNFDTCLGIAEKTFDALPNNGKIFLFEFLKDDDRSNPWLVQSYNMAMMLYTEGQQFTFKELKEVLEQVGFQDLTKEPIGDIYTLISATKKDIR